MNRRMLLLAMVLPSLTAAPAHAGWPTLPSEAVLLNTTGAGLSAASDGAGGAFFAWDDVDGIRVLRLDNTGSPAPGWPAQGVLVVNDPSASNPRVRKDSGGGLYVVWVSPGGSLSLQRRLSDGSVAPGWPAQGISFGHQSDATYLSLLDDQAGGTYVVWLDTYMVRATRFNGNGTLASGWFLSGRAMMSIQNVRVAYCSDMQGGLYFVWSSGTGARIERRNPSGVLYVAWQSVGFDAGVENNFLFAAPDGEGGVAVAWSGQTSPGPTRTAVFHLGADGNPAPGWPADGGWLEPFPLDTWPREIEITSGGAPLVVTGEYGGPVRAWKLAPDGIASGWPADGLVLEVGNHWCGTPDEFALLPDDAGGFYYTRECPYDLTDLSLGRIDAGGATVPGWGSGVLIRSESAHREDFHLTPNGAGGLIASWRVRLATPLAEATHVNPDGTLGPAASLDVPATAASWLALGMPRPNPTRAGVSLTLDLPEVASSSVAVFDLQGRLVRSLEDGMLAAGRHDLHWDLEDHKAARARPGIYLIRATVGGITATRRVVVSE